MGLKSASTVVCALHARSAVGLESASTVVSAENARSAGRPNDIGSTRKTKTKQRFSNRSSFHRELLSTLSPTRSCAVGQKWKKIVDSIVVVSLAPLLLPCPPSSSSSLLSQPLPGQLILAAPAALRRLTSHDRPERHARGHPAASARSLPDPHLPSPQRIAPLIRGDPAGSRRHRERLALIVGAIALELLASDGHR